MTCPVLKELGIRAHSYGPCVLRFFGPVILNPGA